LRGGNGRTVSKIFARASASLIMKYNCSGDL